VCAELLGSSKQLDIDKLWGSLYGMSAVVRQICDAAVGVSDLLDALEKAPPSSCLL